jgi:hypothetical protein
MHTIYLGFGLADSEMAASSSAHTLHASAADASVADADAPQSAAPGSASDPHPLLVEMEWGGDCAFLWSDALFAAVMFERSWRAGSGSPARSRSGRMA